MDVTSYTENYLRLHLLEIKGCTPILKCLVLKVVNDSSANGDVDKYLKLFKNDIKNNKPPKTPEYKMLFPSNGKTDVDKWDIALLVFVLVHCCTLDGQLSLKKNKTPNALLKKEIDEQGDLYEFLSKNKDMIEQLKSSGEITDEQYDRLDPQKCQPTNTWDIELILRILFKLRIPTTSQILNEVVVRKVTLCNETNDLKVFLTKHKSKLYELKRLGKLTNSQYEQLFPNDIIPDIGNWEDGVLLCVVIHVCKCFSDDTYKSVKTIREMRNALFAHNTHTEIDNEDFKQKWDTIVNAITTTVKNEKLDIDVNAAIRDYRDGPLDIKSVVADVKEYYTNHFRTDDAVLEILCSIESTLSTMVSSMTSMSQLIEKQSQQIKELNEKLEEERKDRKELLRMVECIYRRDNHTENYRKPIHSQKIPVKIDITSNNLESAKKAEHAAFCAFKRNEDTNTEHLQDSINKIQNMYTGEGLKVCGIEIGSVILVVRCSSLLGVHTLLRITDSADLQTCLRQLEYELNKIAECPIRIDASIPIASLQKMIDLLENIDLHLDETSNSTEAGQIQDGTEMLHHTDQREESTDETSNFTEAGQIQNGTQMLLDTDKREETRDETGNFTVAGQIQDSNEMLPDTDQPEELTDETSNSTEAGQIQDSTEMLHHTDKREESTDSVLDISTLGDLKPKPELYEALLRVGQLRAFHHLRNDWWTHDYDISEKLLRRVPELKYSEKGIILEVEVRLSVYSTRNTPWAIGILTSAFEGIENDDTRHIKGITDTIKNLYGQDSFEIKRINNCLDLAMPCSSLREIHNAFNVSEGAIQLYILLLETELTLMTGCRFVLSAEISSDQHKKLTEMLRTSLITELKEKLKEESKDRNEKQIPESLLYELFRSGPRFDETVLKETLKEDRKELMQMVELIYNHVKHRENYLQQIQCQELMQMVESIFNSVKHKENNRQQIQSQALKEKLEEDRKDKNMVKPTRKRKLPARFDEDRPEPEMVNSPAIPTTGDTPSTETPGTSETMAEPVACGSSQPDETSNSTEAGQIQDSTEMLHHTDQREESTDETSNSTEAGQIQDGTQTLPDTDKREESTEALLMVGQWRIFRHWRNDWWTNDYDIFEKLLRRVQELKYSEKGIILEVEVRLSVNSTRNVPWAIGILTSAFEGIENDDTRHIKGITDSIKNLYGQDSFEIKRINNCLVLAIPCSSLREIHIALNITEGVIQLYILLLQTELTRMTRCSFVISAELSPHQLEKLTEMLRTSLITWLKKKLNEESKDIKDETSNSTEAGQKQDGTEMLHHTDQREELTVSDLDIKLGDLILKQEFQDELVQVVLYLVCKFPDPTSKKQKESTCLTISDYRTIQIPAQRRPYGSGLKEQKQDLAVVKSESEELSDKPKCLVMEAVNTSERPVSPVWRDRKLERRTITYADDFISSLSDMTYITSLTLSYVDFKDSMATFPIMERMHTLTLSNVRAQENTMTNFISSLSNMPHLAKLTLVLIDLKNSQTTFPVMESMQSLVLSHVSGQKDSMAMFLTSVSNMKHLSDLSIIYVDLNNIQICQIIDSVQTLTLDNVIVSEERMPKFIASLSGMINIEELSLSYVNLNDSKTTFPAIGSLTSLKLNCTKPKDGVMSTIISSKSYLTNLTSLTLTKVIFEDSEIAVSSTLKPSDCRACDGTMNGLLAALEHLTSLTIKDTNLGNSKSTFPIMHNIQVLTLDKIHGEYDTLFFFLVSLTNLRKMTSAALLSNKMNFPLQITLNEITLNNKV